MSIAILLVLTALAVFAVVACVWFTQSESLRIGLIWVAIVCVGCSTLLALDLDGGRITANDFEGGRGRD
jgi:hypothetical protein